MSSLSLVVDSIYIHSLFLLLLLLLLSSFFFFFFNDTATTEIYTLSLHDALPILQIPPGTSSQMQAFLTLRDQLVRSQIILTNQYTTASASVREDRKSTRLNSSHT